MKLKFNAVEELMPGTLPSVYNLPNSVMLVYVDPNDDKMYYRVSPNPDGVTGLRWIDDVGLQLLNDDPKLISTDNDVDFPAISYAPAIRAYYTWKSGDRHRISMLPDISHPYDPDETHRLYYGVDSKILYMNISQFWEMISTLQHGLLYGLDQDHHPQYLKRLSGSELPTPKYELWRQFYILEGGDGEGDKLYVCIKDEDGNYYWYDIMEFELEVEPEPE